MAKDTRDIDFEVCTDEALAREVEFDSLVQESDEIVRILWQQS